MKGEQCGKDASIDQSEKKFFYRKKTGFVFGRYVHRLCPLYIKKWKVPYGTIKG